MQNLLEERKIEHKDAIERGDERDGMRVHFKTLEILQAVRSGGINPAMVDDFYRRAGSVFLDLADRAQRENRTQTALYYRRRGSDYRGDA